ncbi:MAG: hypothetical protein ABI648_08025 [Betaproteobacteria bacterium]
MLRSLFQAIEQSLGPSLDTVASVALWAGLALLAHRLFAPLLRLYMEIASARLKLQQSVVMECPYCHRETVVHDAQCAFCRKSLELPLSVRAWHFMRLRRQPLWWQRTRWIWDSLGLAAFVALTVAGITALHAWSPAGPLQRLFIGLALAAWVALSWLIARVLHLGSGGPVARLRDTVFAFALAGALTVLLLFAAEARPVAETVMWRIPVGEGGIARIDNQALALPQGMIGFEYLQVDHELLGYHHVIPLAFLGSERMEIKHAGIEKWFLNNLWKHGQGYSERGLSVRSRVEQFIVVPNQSYEVVERDKQVYFRPAAAPAQ